MSDFDLENRINKAKKNLKREISSENNHSSIGGRLIIDLIAGIIVGGFLGYHLDKYLGVSPLFLVALLVLGAFGGLYSFYKELNKK